MIQVTVSPDLAEKIRAAKEPVQVVDETGDVLGSFQFEAVMSAEEFRRQIVKTKSPFTREETEARRHQTGGHTTAEVMEHLRKLS